MNLNADSFDALQLDLAKRSLWNIGYFYAGLTFWIYVALAGMYYPLEVAKIYWLVGTFCIFPIAILASKIIGAEPFTKGNKLADLVGYTHMSVIALTFPIIIAVFIYFPEAMLLVMAIAYCLDFYVMSWAFGSPFFGVHAALRIILVSIIWFALPEWRISIIPIVVACAYLITVAFLPIIRKKWLANKSI